MIEFWAVATVVSEKHFMGSEQSTGHLGKWGGDAAGEPESLCSGLQWPMPSRSLAFPTQTLPSRQIRLFPDQWAGHNYPFHSAIAHASSFYLFSETLYSSLAPWPLLLSPLYQSPCPPLTLALNLTYRHFPVYFQSTRSHDGLCPPLGQGPYLAPLLFSPRCLALH